MNKATFTLREAFCSTVNQYKIVAKKMARQAKQHYTEADGWTIDTVNKDTIIYKRAAPINPLLKLKIANTLAEIYQVLASRISDPIQKPHHLASILGELFDGKVPKEFEILVTDSEAMYLSMNSYECFQVVIERVKGEK